jgi:hypothetical protein
MPNLLIAIFAQTVYTRTASWADACGVAQRNASEADAHVHRPA